MAEALDYAMEKDVVVVAAAGNSSSAAPFYPAADPMVLGVAASNPDDQLYSWSNRGAWVKVAAPGCNTSIWPHDGYVGLCGTSAAAPIVAGVAALVRSARPQATAAEVEEAVATDVDAISADVGRGRVNAYHALTGAGASAVSTRATRTIRGGLDPRTRRRTHLISVGPGKLMVVLSFTGRQRLTLLLMQHDRKTVQVSGGSPLRLKANASTGTAALVVKGRRGTRATYRLTVSYAAP
jgi:subtilisin family serine protease